MPATNLHQLLQVEPLTAPNVFMGAAHPTANGRSFGGQIMGQAAFAAGQTIAADRMLHSLHGYFLRPGTATLKTRFEIDKIFTGGSFATRRAQAYQEDTAIMSLIASFQKPSVQPGFAASYPISQLPAPESLASLGDIYKPLEHERHASFILNRPFEFRYIDPDVFVQVTCPNATQRVWLQAKQQLAADQLLHRAALTFASDYLFIEPALRGYGLPWATPGLKAASLDIALWFHENVNVNEWLLYELETVHAGSGRALTTGRFFNRAGVLIASCAQEVMLRLPHEALNTATGLHNSGNTQDNRLDLS